ncbi:MAG: ABC transporter ATP-binding protein [Ktedonobacterales bacterium]
MGRLGVAEKDDILLEVNNVSVDYAAGSGTVHAVTNVSFRLHKGEILGLAGESGSGKSTLAYAISRLLQPPAIITQGEVVYFPSATHGSQLEPVRIFQLSSQELRELRWNDLALVFQSAMNALNPVMTVGAQIIDVLHAHRPDMKKTQQKERAAELLQLVGISPERLGSYPHELSGGMRQRATIAIALALSPEIIIMDEPTTALDVVVQREILTEIMRLREQLRFAVIFITHDLSLLLEMADTIGIMYAGRIVEQASCNDLYQYAAHPYSYGLMHSFPPLHGPRRRGVGIPGSPPDLRAIPAGCAFHPRCPFAFESCWTTLPVLQPLTAGAGRLVACHLYRPEYRADPPTEQEMAAKFAALAEGMVAG